ncbi:MAG: SDR family oxidoreductase [Candidatus Paceibacterota bacterium]|nr:MAG: SDR family oxidoreductase [Candidatus Paceibacterota bacterium]
MGSNLKDKVVIITGGTSGIGLATAKLFSEEGARVVIASNREEGGDDIAQSISSECLFVQTDVREEHQVKNLISKAIEKFGKLDILVNSAGVYSFSQGDIVQMPTTDFDLTMDVNFKGIFLMTKFAIPELAKTKGNIVNISSALGLVPEKESAIYCASKSAVIMFSKATALQLSEKEIRVNSICPGPIDTPMLRSAFPEKEEYDSYIKLNPMKRVGTPEEVARLILFVASESSGYITGGVFTIDGGESLK